MIAYRERGPKKAQAAIEYLLLFAIVAMIVFIGFRYTLPRSGEIANAYFQKTSQGIMGEAPTAFNVLILPLNRGACDWTDWTPENTNPPERICPQFNPTRPFMAGRQHSGGAFGLTRHYCCASDPEKGLADIVTESWNDERTVNIQCPSTHPFMIGRNFNASPPYGKSTIYCAKTNDATVTVDMLGSCEWSDMVIEDANIQFMCPPARPFMSGRMHTGMTDGDTLYLCCPATYEP